ncbi:MAG: low molecular weight protein-tyrosine-phosphatase [Actinomycetaceae bacterium]|nr:low molecular weight protein-tyrosine-phosphatase [Actinomycetaceae bacterium]
MSISLVPRPSIAGSDKAPGVLFVCTGNICRSAMAEVVMVDYCQIQDIQVRVDSAGVSYEESGNPMDRRAARELSGRGYELRPHQARQIHTQDFHDYDLILAMTAGHFVAIQAFGNRKGIEFGQPGQPRLEMFKVFDPANFSRLTEALNLGQDGSNMPSSLTLAGVEAGLWTLEADELMVADPWYGGPKDFEITANEVETVIPVLAASL